MEPRPRSFYVLAVIFGLFVLFLYGPTITIGILSFQGPGGGLTFPMRGVSLHWFRDLFQEQAVGDIWGAFRRSFALGLMVAGRSRSHFGYLASSGAVVTIAFYVFVNIAMVSGMLPVVGVPLPLISYGGTAMMTVMAAFAVICATNLDRDKHLSISGFF